MNVGTRVKLSSAMVKAACKGNASGMKYHCKRLLGVLGTVTYASSYSTVVLWDGWKFAAEYSMSEIEVVS